MSRSGPTCHFCGEPLTEIDGICCQDPVCSDEFDAWVFSLEQDEAYVTFQEELNERISDDA